MARGVAGLEIVDDVVAKGLAEDEGVPARTVR